MVRSKNYFKSSSAEKSFFGSEEPLSNKPSLDIYILADQPKCSLSTLTCGIFDPQCAPYPVNVSIVDVADEGPTFKTLEQILSSVNSCDSYILLVSDNVVTPVSCSTLYEAIDKCIQEYETSPSGKKSDLYYLGGYADDCSHFCNITSAFPNGTVLADTYSIHGLFGVLIPPGTRAKLCAFSKNEDIRCSNKPLGMFFHDLIESDCLSARRYLPSLLVFNTFCGRHSSDWVKTCECREILPPRRCGDKGCSNLGLFWFIIIILLVILLTWALIQLRPSNSCNSSLIAIDTGCSPRPIVTPLKC